MMFVIIFNEFINGIHCEVLIFAVTQNLSLWII